jgi:hypothetical protein
MIASYKRKANIAGAIFMAAIIGLFVLGWTGHKMDMGDDSVAIPFAIAFIAPYFYGMWAYLKAKGRSSAWMLLAGSTVIGMIVILLLKDHAKDGQPPAPPAPQEYFG